MAIRRKAIRLSERSPKALPPLLLMLQSLMACRTSWFAPVSIDGAAPLPS